MSLTQAQQTTFERLCHRVLAIRTAVGDDWPYHRDPVQGDWDVTTDGDWCGGHWVECLRIVGEVSGNRELTEESADRTERLRPYLERDDMFRAHRFYYSASRQFATSGEQRFRTLALAAAWAVRSMEIRSAGLMPIGTQVQVRSAALYGRDVVCIDNVHPNLILDWWAHEQTGDPAFVEGARRHLDRTVRDFILPDGSTVEFRNYDLRTGEAGNHYTLLGASDDSCWARGQAWAVAGYLRAYEALGDQKYLAVGLKLLEYWIGNSAPHLVPPWDFKDPAWRAGEDVPLDTSAAAIVVEQLARLRTKAGGGIEPEGLVGVLERMLDGLQTFVDESGVLTDGCFNYPKRYAYRSELIWGTAYLLFGLYYLHRGSAPT